MDRSKPIHIINVPLDLGASRRGTDAGPSAVRIAGLSAALADIGYTLTEETDILVPGMENSESQSMNARYKNEILAVCRTLANQVVQAMEAGEIPLVIGGDHSIAMGTVSGLTAYLKRDGQKLGLIWFDAHGDMNLPSTSPSGNVHGMPLAHLMGHGDPELASVLNMRPAVDPERVVLIGIRDIDRGEREIIWESGVTAFTMRDIDEHGMSRVARKALDIVCDGTAGFHVSFDVDGCDPSVMPGSGTLVPGGVSFREAHLLLEECASSGKMLAMEVVELNPFLDLANVSAERAVSLIQSAFGRSIL